MAAGMYHLKGMIFDAPEIQEHKNRYKEMPIISCEVLK